MPGAADRTAKIKNTQRQAVRDKFKGIEYVRQLEICAKELDKLREALIAAKKKKLSAKDKSDIRMYGTQVHMLELDLKILKEKIHLNFKRLNYVCPPLRSIELTDPNGNNPLNGFIDLMKEAMQNE